MNTEPFSQHKERILITHTAVAPTSFQTALPAATQYFCWLPREHTTIGARASKEVDRVGHTNRLQHPSGSIGPPLILIVKRSRSQLFLSIRFCGATALTEKNRDDSLIPSNCAWRVVVSIRSSKDSSRFFTVEAVALQNLPQTLRGRERSKRGYASPLLLSTILSEFLP